MPALVLIAMAIAACGTPPPCNVEPEQVDQARAEYKAAESAAAEVASEIETLEAEIASLKSKVISADELAKLEARLDELKKGSGR